MLFPGQSDEEVPYRSHVPEGIASDNKPTWDEDNFDTLKVVHSSLRDSMAALDKWHVFDLEEKDGLDIKQQILAHRLAYGIVAPLEEAIRNAISVIDDKYRDR